MWWGCFSLSLQWRLGQPCKTPFQPKSRQRAAGFKILECYARLQILWIDLLLLTMHYAASFCKNGNSFQILTTAPIFLQCNYFRQKYLDIPSWSDSLLIYIWVRVDHSLQSTAAVKIAKESVAIEAFCRQDVNKIVGTSWTPASDKHTKYF